MNLLFINMNLKSSEKQKNGLPATYNAAGSSIIDIDATYCITGRTSIRKISDWLLSLEEVRTRING